MLVTPLSARPYRSPLTLPLCLRWHHHSLPFTVLIVADIYQPHRPVAAANLSPPFHFPPLDAMAAIPFTLSTSEMPLLAATT
jgi:hypothetical protein